MHRAEVVSRWEEIPNEEIAADHDVLYDHWDPELRQVIDIASYPHQNESGERVNAYDESGHRIIRWSAMVANENADCGIMVKLKEIDRLFAQDDDEVREEEIDAARDLGMDIREEDERVGSGRRGHSGQGEDVDREACQWMRGKLSKSAKVSRYPQAFLKDVGHVQSDGIARPFRAVVRRLNENIEEQRARTHDPNVREDLNPDIVPVPAMAVVPLGSQYYNEIFHRIAPHAGGHVLQLGYVTAALSGKFANDEKGKAKAARLQASLSAELPHKQINKLMLDKKAPRALRLEQVFFVNMVALPQSKRRGSYIYSKVMSRLMEEWRHAEVMQEMKQYLVVFKNQVSEERV